MLGSLRLLQPTTVSEAAAALRDLGERGKIYAGGAELLLLMRHGFLCPEVLVDIKKIAALTGVAWEDGALRVGASVSHHALESHPLVREHASMFAHAESQVANIRVRNQGTIGGNLCFNDPHSDPGTALLVYEASATVGGRAGDRRVPLDEFFIDMYATALENDELLIDIRIPPLPAGMRGAYLRLHRYQRPTLGVAAAARLRNGGFQDVRLAIGCIGPRTRRLRELEAKLRGASLDDAHGIIAGQKDYLRELLRPVDDLLGSASYKMYMACALLGRALAQVAQGNGEGRHGHGIG